MVPGKKKIFLKTLRQTGNASAAAREAGVDLQKAYEKRKKDKTFQADWTMAIEGALDDLEEEIRRRALEGTDKPVYYAGKKCGTITSFNDNLAMFLLKAKRPEVFSEEAEKNSPTDPINTHPREVLLRKLKEMKPRPAGDEK